MERYIGMDVHKESCTLAVMGPSGKRLKELVVETSAGELRRTLKAVPGQKRLVMEEGRQADWLCEVLSPSVQELVVVQPGRCPGVKSDSKDAWGLANALRAGLLPTVVYKAPTKYAELRAAVRAQLIATQEVVRCKQRVRGHFIGRGVKLEGRRLYTEANRAELLAQLPAPQRRSAELSYGQLDALIKVAEEAEGWLEEAAKRTPAVLRLRTIPGIATIRASQIVATVITPHRFSKRQQYWSYCGLGIVTRSSSDWTQDSGKWKRKEVQQTRGLNRNHNHVLKNVYVGAAMSVTQTSGSNAFRRHYERLLEGGTKPNLARLTIARRLASTSLAIWKKETAYDPATPEPSQQGWLGALGRCRAPKVRADAEEFREEASDVELATLCGEQAPRKGYALLELPAETMAQRGPARRIVPDL